MTVRYETLVLNYGGGAQTVAICVMICRGVLPRPDHIVIADTSRERTSTFDYLRDHCLPYLEKHGLTVKVASHELATVDLYSHKGELLIPAFTASGKFSAFCSGEWKTQVVRRYLRSIGVTSATSWIGYAYDEKRRWKNKELIDGPWRIAFPLVDRMLLKADCPVIIRKAGLPVPEKSCCWMCPNQHNAQWKKQKKHYPADFEKACQVDEKIREEDEEHAFYLHESRVPLREADLDAKDRRDPERQCTLGVCFV